VLAPPKSASPPKSVSDTHSKTESVSDTDFAECGVRGVLAARRAEFGGRWFAERYIEGREINVGLLAGPEGARVLPVAEIDFGAFPATKPRIVGYAAKWDAESFEYRNTPRRFG